MRKKTKLAILLSGLAAGVLVAVLVPILVVFVFTAARFSFYDNVDGTRVFSWDSDELHALPQIVGNRQFNAVWSIQINPGDELIELNQENTHFTIAPKPVTQTTVVNALFRATINYNRGTTHLDFPLEIRYETLPYFTNLFSPQQTNRVAYRTQGLANRRVFGLWDLNWETPGLHQRADYVKSSDTFTVATRYQGGLDSIDLEVQVVQGRIVNTDEASAEFANNPIGLNNSFVNVTKTGSRVDVDFIGEGTVTVIVRGEHKSDDTSVQYYWFTYEIINGVNAFTFADVKAVEYNARMEFIVNGVPNSSGGHLIYPLGHANAVWPNYAHIQSERRGQQKTLNQFRIENATLCEDNPLNSALFHIGVNENFRFTGSSITTRPFPSEYLMEFYRWAPAFSYKRLVIRASMQTWEEATWFLGSVYGNGHTLDATPYSTNSARQYRNSFSTGSSSEGLENASFAVGSGWGDQYAFYAVSNDSTIDNLHMIGQVIRHDDGRPVRLNEYRTMSVFSTASIGGFQRCFQIGNRHDQGVFHEGMFNAGITLSHSIVEMGLILVGAYYLPDQDRPLLVKNSVLRFAGFTGVFARGISGDTGVHPDIRNNNEGGHYVALHNNLGHVAGSTIREDRSHVLARLPVGQRQPRDMRFGVFIVLYNIFAYEFTTVPIIIDDGIGEVSLTIKGDSNMFYTWIRITDLVFPEFRLPDGAFPARPHVLSPVPDVTGIAQGLLRNILQQEQFRDSAVRDGAHQWINLPLISVGVDTRTFWDVDVLQKDMHVLDMPIPVGDMGLTAVIKRPINVDIEAGEIHVEKQRQLFERGNITGAINTWARGLQS